MVERDRDRSRRREQQSYRPPLNTLQIANRFCDQIRSAYVSGKDLTEVTHQLNQLLGTNYSDPREIHPQLFRQVLDGLMAQLDVSLDSYEALADSILFHALKWIQTQSQFSKLTNYDDRVLLATYLSVDDWRIFNGIEGISGLVRNPHLLINRSPESVDLSWPQFDTAYWPLPARDANLSSRTIQWYVYPKEGSIQTIIEEGISKIGHSFSITDVGMGEGRVVHDLKVKYGDAVQINGVTLDNVQVDGVNVVVTPAEYMSQIQSDSQNLVLSNYASCYFLWPKRAYREIVRILKPGGQALIDASAFCRIPPFREDHQYIGYHLGSNRDEVLAIFRQNYWGLEPGFENWKQYFEQELGPQLDCRLVVERGRSGDGYGTALHIRKVLE